MAERSFVREVASLRLGSGEAFSGENILAVAKALLECGVSYVGGYQGAPISHLMDVFADARPLLDELGVPYLRPTGGHAVYVDARRALPHIPQHEFPAQVFTAALYAEGGVRGVEIGSLMFEHRDPDTGEMVHPAMELVRLAVPRRVYTHTQLDYVAECCARVMALGERLRGLEIMWEPPALRHFTATLRPVGGGAMLQEA